MADALQEQEDSLLPRILWGGKFQLAVESRWVKLWRTNWIRCNLAPVRSTMQSSITVFLTISTSAVWMKRALYAMWDKQAYAFVGKTKRWKHIGNMFFKQTWVCEFVCKFDWIEHTETETHVFLNTLDFRLCFLMICHVRILNCGTSHITLVSSLPSTKGGRCAMERAKDCQDGSIRFHDRDLQTWCITLSDAFWGLKQIANFHFSPRPRSTWNVGARMIQLTLWVAFAGLGDDLFRRKSPLSPGWASEFRCFIAKLSKLQLGSFSSSRATQVFEGFSSFAASFTWIFASC